VARSNKHKSIGEKIGDKIAEVADHVLHPQAEAVESSEDSSEEVRKNRTSEQDELKDHPKFAKFNRGK
jgi:hypothetical protein